MDVRIEPNADWEISDRLERELGWTRGKTEVRRRYLADPGAHFVARDAAGDVLGAVGCVLHPATAHAPRALAWVGGMVVRETARGRGVGRALLRRALARASEAGADLVGLDATAEGRPLYASEGFRPLHATVRWRRDPAARRPEPGDRGPWSIYPISSCEIMELAAYDGPRFGASRAAWLAAVVADLPDRAFVAFHRGTGALGGFALGQEARIGPVVADDPRAASWLLFAVERAGAPPVVDVVDENEHAPRVLEAAGYAPTQVVTTRMARGGDRMPGRPETRYAVGAQALG